MSQMDLSGKRASIARSRSLPEASPVNLSHMPGSAGERRMIVSSGMRCSGLSSSSGPLGLLEKTLLASPLWSSTMMNLRWKRENITIKREERFTLTDAQKEIMECDSTGKATGSCVKFWTKSKERDTMSQRSLFRLVPLAPRTEGIESSLLDIPENQDAPENELKGGLRFWPTPTHLDSSKPIREPCNSEINSKHGVMLVAAVFDSLQEEPQFMWPTPRANERGDYQRDHGQKGKERPTLMGAVRMFPTPTAQDAKNTAGPSQKDRNTLPLNTLVTMLPTPNACMGNNNGRLDEWGGSGNPFRGTREGRGCLNPLWVELLMGLPPGWTDLNMGEE
jgi:hypothetical protein